MCVRRLSTKIGAIKNIQRYGIVTRSSTTSSGATTTGSRPSSPWSSATEDRPVWSKEWKRFGLGATLVDAPVFPQNLFFVQLGHGVDQHGDNDATKAAIRAVRNAVEFNSIPGVISHIPGGRPNMLVHVKLGVPAERTTVSDDESTSASSRSHLDKPMPIDHLQVAKVFPYGKLLPFEVVVGGLSFHTGRVVEELGDTGDVGICVTACVSIGYDEEDNGGSSQQQQHQHQHHRTFNTKDGSSCSRQLSYYGDWLAVGSCGVRVFHCLRN